MRPKPPCKDCTDRKPGCHGVCLYYAQYREKMEAIYAERGEAARDNMVFSGYMQKAMHRMKTARRPKRSGGKT